MHQKRGKTVDDHKGLYQAEIIQQMANRVYFKKRTDDGILLRAQYSPFPVPALALILTAVSPRRLPVARSILTLLGLRARLNAPSMNGLMAAGPRYRSPKKRTALRTSIIWRS